MTILYCLPLALWTIPVPTREIECQGASLLNYDGQEYEYDYSTKTKLWINDVSDDAKSFVTLSATVLIQSVGPCRYQMWLRNVRTDSASSSDIAASLQANVAAFSIGSNGALASLVKFNGNENNWVRNVKRGIISAFQLRSESDLKTDPLNPSDPKSSVVYETDLFGRCRTTYRTREQNGNIEIVKKKALHRCSLDQYRQSPVQGDEYKNVAVRVLFLLY